MKVLLAIVFVLGLLLFGCAANQNPSKDQAFNQTIPVEQKPKNVDINQTEPPIAPIDNHNESQKNETNESVNTTGNSSITNVELNPQIESMKNEFLANISSQKEELDGVLKQLNATKATVDEYKSNVERYPWGSGNGVPPCDSLDNIQLDYYRKKRDYDLRVADYFHSIGLITNNSDCLISSETYREKIMVEYNKSRVFTSKNFKRCKYHMDWVLGNIDSKQYTDLYVLPDVEALQELNEAISDTQTSYENCETVCYQK